MEERTLVHNKVHRTIPNILKKSSKLRASELSATETKYCPPDIQNTKKEKQLSLTYELPKCNVPKNVSDKKENRRKQKIKSSLVCVSVHGIGLSSCKKWQRKNVPSTRNERQRDLSLIYQNVSTNFHSQHHVESEDAQNSIDFSSNEIFNKFNYEYNNDMASDSSWHVRDSDDTCNSFNAVDFSHLYTDENDINGNEIDTCEKEAYSFLNEDEQAERHVTEKQSLIFSECLNEDTLLTCGIESEISCDSSCDHYCENCVPNWFRIGEVQNNTHANNILFANTLNESSESNLSSLFSQSPITVTHNFLQDADEIDSSLVEFTSQASKRHYQIQEHNDISLMNVQEDRKKLCDSTDETDFSEILKVGGEEEMEVVHDMKTSQIKDNDDCGENIDELLCLLCGLTFSNSRTIAMHQAEAHGGLYTIHCETCGRLFNRKYHFNRHALHCGNSKELFKCGKCPKIYRYKSSLVRHLNVVHHSFCTPRSRTLKCGSCGKIYKNSRAFEKHVQSHVSSW